MYFIYTGKGREERNERNRRDSSVFTSYFILHILSLVCCLRSVCLCLCILFSLSTVCFVSGFCSSHISLALYFICYYMVATVLAYHLHLAPSLPSPSHRFSFLIWQLILPLPLYPKPP